MARKAQSRNSEIQDLRRRLEEAEQTLQAIQNGEVDALVVSGPEGDQVYTLRDATKPYRVLVEELSEGILTLGLDGTILYANNRFAEFLDLPLESILGKRLDTLVAPPYREQTLGQINNARGGKCVGEAVLEHGDKRVPVQFSLREVNFDQGQQIYAVVADISERKRAETEIQALNAKLEQRVLERTSELEAANAQLEEEIQDRERAQAEVLESEERYRRLVEQSPSGIAIHCDRIVVFINPAGARILGATFPEEVVGKSIFDLVHPDDQQIVSDRIHRLLVTQSGTPLLQEKFLRRDGRVAQVEVTAIPTVYRGKTAVQIVFHDISDRKRIEVEREDLLRQVEQERDRLSESERRLEHLNQDLEQHSVELEKANQDLESFSYSVSHDLRAPLASIDMFAHLLGQDHAEELTPEARRYVELIQENSVAMSRLIEDLLAFSRSGRQALRKQKVDPEEIVRGVIAERLKGEEGRKIEVIIGELMSCQADPVLLKQVYANLIANAFKFSRTRSAARIEVGSLIGDKEHVTGDEKSGKGQVTGEPLSPVPSPVTRHTSPVTFFVRDNGVGFDMEHADRLFQVFQRFHTAEEYEGTGVGLAIVERIIRRHGGHIWAESQVDQGATFFFTLPGDQ